MKRKMWNIRGIKYWLLIPAAIFLLCAAVCFQPLAHCPFFDKKEMPEKRSIEAVLEKKRWNAGDYQEIFRQTGLGKPAIDQLRGSKNYKKDDILVYQDSFMRKTKIKCQSTSLFTKQDLIVTDKNEIIPMVPLEEGDILLSFSSHSLGWKHGHAGLVVNAKQKLCLEAVMPGCASKIKSTEHWRTYSGFLVLRLKDADKQERQTIAAYAYQNLTNIPYSLSSGIFGEKIPKGSDHLKAQCAYLIWYAFMHFGYDLDSDGGRLVTVEDVKESPELEIVQCFGDILPY